MSYRRQTRAEKPLLVCEHCRQTFRGRANAKHCSERCRKLAFREREKDRDRRLQGLAAALAKEVGLKPEDL